MEHIGNRNPEPGISGLRDLWLSEHLSVLDPWILVSALLLTAHDFFQLFLPAFISCLVLPALFRIGTGGFNHFQV